MLNTSRWNGFRHSAAVARGMVLIGLSSVAAAGPALDHIRQTGKIVIGHRESSVPFSYMDADKHAVGYAVDLCQRLAEAVRKKLDMKSITVEFLMVTPSNRIALVEEGKVDMECGSTTNNAERRNKVAFTVPHYITGARFMVRAADTATDIVGLEGKRVVSTKGTTPLKAIERANVKLLTRIKKEEKKGITGDVEVNLAMYTYGKGSTFHNTVQAAFELNTRFRILAIDATGERGDLVDCRDLGLRRGDRQLQRRIGEVQRRDQCFLDLVCWEIKQEVALGNTGQRRGVFLQRRRTNLLGRDSFPRLVQLAQRTLQHQGCGEPQHADQQGDCHRSDDKSASFLWELGYGRAC